MKIKGIIITISVIIIALVVPTVTHSRSTSFDDSRVQQANSIIVSGSHDSLIILLPDKDGTCNVQIVNAEIKNLTIYAISKCNSSSINITGSNIENLVIAPGKYLTGQAIILNSTIIHSNITGPTEVIINRSRIAYLSLTTNISKLENTVVGKATVTSVKELVILNSAGQAIDAFMVEEDGKAGNITIEGLLMKCKDLEIPGYTGAYNPMYGRRYSSLHINSSEGHAYMTNITYSCTEGPSYMTVNGIVEGYVSGLSMNSTNSSLTWTSFNSGILILKDSKIYGSSTIQVSTSSITGVGEDSEEIERSLKSSYVVVENTTMGLIPRTGNATRLPLIQGMITAASLNLVDTSINYIDLDLYIANITINNTKINVKRLTVYGAESLKIHNSILNSGLTTISSQGPSLYTINYSKLNSNTILESRNGELNLAIINSSYPGGRTLAIHAFNTSIVLNVTGSKIDRMARISVIGYPPLTSHVNLFTSRSYFGSILGPRIIVNGSLIRPGGAIFEFTSTSTNYDIISWYGDPGMKDLYLNTTSKSPITPINGSIVPAVRTGGSNTTLYLLELEEVSDKIVLKSGYVINMSIVLSGNLTITVTGNGTIVVKLPLPSREAIIIVHSLEPVETQVAKTQSNPSTTPPYGGNTLGEIGGTRSINYLVGGTIILITIVVLSIYLIMRRRERAL